MNVGMDPNHGADTQIMVDFHKMSRIQLLVRPSSLAQESCGDRASWTVKRGSGIRDNKAK